MAYVSGLPSAYDGTAGTSYDQKIQVFSQWLLDNGVWMPGLELRAANNATNERAVFAKQPIEKGQDVLRVPRRLLMTMQNATVTSWGQELIAKCGKNCLEYSTSWLALLLLMEERKPDSFWKPYIDTLPRDVSSFPSMWSEEEMRELRGTRAEAIVKFANEVMEREFVRISRHLPEAQFSFADFKRAFLVACSRNFNVDTFSDGTRETIRSALVPMADMLNHATGYSDRRGTSDKAVSYGAVPIDFSSTLTMKAQRNIAADSEVTDFYGEKCNTRFLVHYGFIFPPNELGSSTNGFNTIELSFVMPVGSRRAKLDSTHSGVVKCEFSSGVSLETGKAAACFSFLRLKHLHGEALAAHKLATKSEKRELVAFQDIPNERLVWLDIAKAVRTRIAQYSTSLAEDLELMRNGTELSGNHRLAVLYRRGEKELAQTLLVISSLVEKWYSEWPDRNEQAMRADLLPLTENQDSKPFQIQSYNLRRYLEEVIVQRLLESAPVE